MIRSLVLLFSFFIISIFAFHCDDGTYIMNPPTDLTQPSYYPPGWSDGQPFPSLKHDQKCFISVNIPNGYYANVTFNSHFLSPAYSFVTYSNNQITNIPNGMPNSIEGPPNTFFFMPPHFKVGYRTVNSTDIDLFTFKVQWTKIPNAPRKVIDIYKNNPPVAITPNDYLTTFVGDFNSMLSLAVFSLADPSKTNLLWQTAVFGGDSFDSPFVGTLDKILSQQYPLTVANNKMSVYTFGLSNLITDPLFMGLDDGETRGYSDYTGASCPKTGNCNITLNGSLGNAVTITDFNGSEFVKRFDSFPNTATVNVYENTVTNSTRIASMTSSNYQSMLPLEVKGTMKFYELRGFGVVNMVVTRDISH